MILPFRMEVGDLAGIKEGRAVHINLNLTLGGLSLRGGYSFSIKEKDMHLYDLNCNSLPVQLQFKWLAMSRD